MTIRLTNLETNQVTLVHSTSNLNIVLLPLWGVFFVIFFVFLYILAMVKILFLFIDPNLDPDPHIFHFCDILSLENGKWRGIQRVGLVDCGVGDGTWITESGFESESGSWPASHCNANVPDRNPAGCLWRIPGRVPREECMRIWSEFSWISSRHLLTLG